MNVLLDTHALIWLVLAPERLGAEARRVMSRKGAIVYASHVSLWELAVKRGVGKLDELDRPAAEWFDRHVRASRLRQMAIGPEHLGAVESLPLHHRDPFDRLLVAQARERRAAVLTVDPAIARYDVEVVW